MSEEAFQRDIAPLLPSGLRTVLSRLPPAALRRLQEIRVRVGRPLCVVLQGGDAFVAADGRLTSNPGLAYSCTHDDAERLLLSISRSSVYALQEEFRSGFLTVSGGHRIGLVGQAVLEGGSVRTLKHIAGFNVRLARQVRGAADAVLERLCGPGGAIPHTLVVSPPQCGKTTLLRDLARQLSDGVPQRELPGRRVGLVDERSELAACYRGVPQLDVGVRTDVLDGCPKETGILMLLRAMSPEVLVTDEIGRLEDARALAEAMGGGVTVIASAHGSSWESVAARPFLRPLLEAGGFGRVVILSARRGPGTLEALVTPA